MYNNKYSELYHYGVKGQKHGQRRYQNADGSLTLEGYRHYGIDPNWQPEKGQQDIPTSNAASSQPSSTPAPKAAASQPNPTPESNTAASQPSKAAGDDYNQTDEYYINSEVRENRYLPTATSSPMTNPQIPENAKNRMNYYAEHYGKTALTDEEKKNIAESKDTSDMLTLYDKWQKVGDNGLTPAEKQKLDEYQKQANESKNTDYNKGFFEQAEDLGIEVDEEHPENAFFDYTDAVNSGFDQIVTENWNDATTIDSDLGLTVLTKEYQDAYDELTKNQINCPYCTLTYELNQRGVPIEAGSGFSNLSPEGGLYNDDIYPMYGYDADDVNAAFNELTKDWKSGEDIIKSTEDNEHIKLSLENTISADDFNNTISDLGLEPGSRYIAIWPGHISNMEVNKDGGIVVNDAQAGIVDMPLADYMNLTGKYDANFTRVDNRDIDMNYVKEHFTGKNAKEANIRKRGTNNG